MEHLRSLPFPVAVSVLFVIVLLRAGGTYALGRLTHAGADRTRLHRLLSSPRFSRAEERIGRWGAPVVAVSFLTVGFQTVVNLAAGVSRMPLRRYVPALLLGGLAWALLYASVGFVTVAALVRLWSLSPLGASAVLVGLLALLAAYVAVQVRHRRRATATRTGGRTADGVGEGNGARAAERLDERIG